MPSYKLNFEEVSDIRYLHSKKIKPVKELAREYRVHEATIRSIVNGKSWRRKWHGLEAERALY